MTTAGVAPSKMPSMPLNALAESAALPGGPVMWTARPFAWLSAMVRSVVAASEAPFQPFEPRLTGTMVSMALPSPETNGPATWLCTTLGTPRNRRASAAAFALSALVTPDWRSYTRTPGKMRGGWEPDCTAHTLVDPSGAVEQ